MLLAVRSTARRATCAVLLASLAAPSWAQSNNAPRIISQADRVASVQRGFTYALRAQDADGDAVRYALSTAPTGARIDAVSGDVTWQPSASQIGKHPFVVTAEDGKTGKAEQAFELTVVDDFCPIYPIALPLDAIAPLSVGQRIARLPRGVGNGNFSWLTWAGAVDTPTLAQSLVPPGNSDTFVEPSEPSDHQLDVADWVQGAPGAMNASQVRAQLDALLGRDILLPVWDSKRESGGRLDYRVARFASVRLVDFDLTGHGWLALEYRGVGDCYNQKPVALPQSLQTDEDVSLTLVLSGTDSDGDALAFRIVDAPEHGTLTGTGAQRSYTPAANYSGPDRLTFVANDGQLDSAPATVDILVRPVNDAPEIVTTVLPAGAAIGRSYTATVEARDIDGDALQFGLVTPPEGATIDATTGVLTWTPLGAGGPTTLTVRVSDTGGLAATRDFTLTVTPNTAPVFTTMPDTVATEASAYSYDADATDADGDTLQFVLVDAPSGAQFEATRGEITWSPTAAQVGVQTFTIEVRDDRGASEQQTWTVTVELRNRAPQITSTAPLATTAGSPYRYDVEAADADGDALSFTLVASPAGMSIDTTTGEITWSPSAEQVGSHVVTVRVADVDGARAEQSFTLTVSAANRAPSITSTPMLRVDERQSYEYSLTATDPDAEPVTLAERSTPSASTFDASTGQLRWQAPAASAGLRVRNLMCREPARPRDFDPVVAWEWNGSTTLPSHDEVMMSPLVVQATDDNGDGRIDAQDVPDVAFIAYDGDFSTGGGVIRLVSGNDGREIATSAVEHSLDVWSQLAAGDIDHDGKIEFVGVRGGTGTLFVFEHDLSLKYRSTQAAALYGTSVGGVALADLDGDGEIEIVFGDAAFRAADGSTKWKGNGLTIGSSHDNYGGALSFAVDVHPSPGLEVIAGPQLYSATGQVLWRVDVGDSVSAVADLDADGSPDLVYAGRGQIASATHLGQLRWKKYIDYGRGGPPAIGDLDGDGRPEIVIAGERVIQVFRHDGTEMWRAPIQDQSSLTAATIFDFEGDGRPEIAYADEYRLQIFDGATGAVRTSLTNSSGTAHEYPTVADADADGSADILLVRNRYQGAHIVNQGVRMISSASRNWMPTRSLWNQYAYHVDNVNDDGSIPAHETASWTTRNSFRMNAFVDRHPLGRADLAPFDLKLSSHDDGDRVAVRVVNRGMGPSGATAATLRAVGAAGVLATAPVPALAAGAHADVAFERPSGTVEADLEVHLDGADAVAECVETNNQATGRFFSFEARDPRGLSDRQRFLVAVENVNEAPTWAAIDVPDLKAGDSFSLTVAAQDADLGDALRYVLREGPAGMTLDELTGELRWNAPLNAAGQHRLRIAAIDLTGASANTELTLTVTANRAPTFTSEPPTSATVGVPYRYQLVASDADGDALSFDLVQSPLAMEIDAAGLVTFTPVLSQVGAHAVVLRVNDPRGAFAEQTYTLTVSAAHENRPPTITSEPFATAKVGKTYAYAATATDPDGDTLTWSLLSAPTGMTVNASTGALAFTPTQSGPVEVVLRATDGDFYADQSWTLTVLDASFALAGTLHVAPSPVAPGGTITATLGVTGAAGPVVVTATLDGATITLSANAATPLTASTTPGEYVVAATLTDGHDTITLSKPFYVSDPNDTTGPDVKIVLPAEHPQWDAVEITAPTDVTGFVRGDDTARWFLGVQERGTENVTILVEGTGPFTEREIGQFDPTQLLNGLYTLVLQATDRAGNVSFDSRILRVTGDMKLGHFSLSFEEVSIPVAGIPVTVTRTYDTRRASQSLDFGYGWTVDTNNVRVQESRRLGFAWDVFTQGGTFGQRCIRPLGDPIVTVTLPDGEVASFKAKAEPECQSFAGNSVFVELVFEAIDGTDHTLEQTDYTQLRWGTVAGQAVPILHDDGAGEQTPADPRHYRLTTDDGLVYELDQQLGVRKVTDQGSETHLTFDSTGVRHSTGVGIEFVRDAQGRITQMQLPDGETLDYSYSTLGDLQQVADAAAETTQFTYVDHPRYPHYLKDLIDARGIRVTRNEYDDDGRLKATIDAEGHRIEYSHDIEGRTSVIKNRRGFSLVHVYDENGRTLRETNVSAGETITHSFDAEGNELTRTNAENETTRWSYDLRGNRLSQTNHDNETTTWTYNHKNQLLTEVDAAQRPVLTHTYETRSHQLLTSTLDAVGHATTFGYIGGTGTFGTGVLAGFTTADQATTRYSYSPQGFTTAEIDAGQNATTYVHDAHGRVTEERRTRVVNGITETLVTKYAHDEKGRLVETTHPDMSVTTVDYDANGMPIRECDGLQRCTRTTYNARGEVERIDHADDTFETRRYDPNGNLVASTDQNGRTTTFVYDPADRLTATSYPDDTPATDSDNARITNSYDKAGRLVESTDEHGRATTYRYDSAGRRTRVIAPDPDTGTTGSGPETQTTYDATGRREALTDANGRVTRFVYDAAGRMTETIHPDDTPNDDNDNPRSKVEYDGVGNKVVEIDEAGRATRYAYDKLGRLIAVVLPDPTTGANPPLVDGQSPESGTLTTRYRYDELGNKTEQIDAEGRATRWEYDTMGRETARVLPEGQRESKRYNAAGELIEHIDFNGDATEYRYDRAGRVDRIEYADGRIETFGYDHAGNRTNMASPEGTWAWQYDTRNRVIRETQPTGSVLEYGYDAVGNRTVLSTVVGAERSEATYTFDALRRLIGATDVTGTTVFDYDAAGNRVAMQYPNGVMTRYQYDPRYRLTSLETRDASQALQQQYRYTLDATGRRIAISETDSNGLRETAYTYDRGYRLTGEAQRVDGAPAFEARYDYDRVGNRTYSVIDGVHTAYSYDRNDRLLQQGGERHDYDNNGNELRLTEGGDVTENTYDARGKLVRSVAQSAGQATTSTFAYDPDGHRTGRTHGAQTTRYIVDRQREHAEVLAELDSAGAINAQYLHADELLSQQRGGVASYYLADGHGSTRALVDAGGAVTDRYRYDAWGVLLGRQGATLNDYLYTGEAWDPALDAYYLRARYYDPAVGRFTQQDRWRGSSFDPVSLHKYLYANADPVNGRDPSGNFTLMEMEATANIRTTLGNMQAEAGFTMLDVAMNRGQFDAGAYLGGAVFFGAMARVAPKLFASFLSRCRNSFVEGTLVHTERGRIPIEEVEIGDKVWSFNETTGEEGWNEVLHLIEGEKDYELVTITTESGEVFTATEGHPLYTAEGRWVDAREVRAGDRLVREGGESVEVVTVAKEMRQAKVWNLTIESAETYYIGYAGVLAHNSGCKAPRLGGSYKEIADAMPNRRELAEVEHIPPRSAAALMGISKNDGVAIPMLFEHHRDLRSSRNDVVYLEAIKDLVRQGKFDDAFDMEANEIRRVAGARYEMHIAEAREYCRRMGWCKQ